MNITRQQLTAIIPKATKQIDKYICCINAYADMFHINTPLRMCHYLAQVLHESAEFKYTVEQGSRKYFDKYDTGKLASQLGNTPAKDGDGYKYRGRGLIQITGKRNYLAYQNSGFCTGDIINKPELLEKPLGAVKSSMWWWNEHKCNFYADKDDVDKITRIINGGTNGLLTRKKYLAKAKVVLLK